MKLGKQQIKEQVHPMFQQLYMSEMISRTVTSVVLDGTSRRMFNRIFNRQLIKNL